MYQISNKVSVILLSLIVLVSCHGLEDLNESPNSIGKDNVDINLLVPTIISSTAVAITNLGFGDISGVMQHTQRDGWSTSHNAYDWDTGTSWNAYYAILTDNKTLIEKAEAENSDYHLGVGLVMKSYVFGLITDLWGDIPYTEALKGAQGAEFFDASYDDQQSVYENILEDLKTANTLLSKDQSEYTGINDTQDILFNGDVSKWRKFANALALRYYMRLSVKTPAFAETGIKTILNNPNLYPLILEASDDATVAYIGTSTSDSWPTNTVYDNSSTGTYNRTKLAKTFVDVLQALEDPRLSIWANKVEVPLVLEAGAPDDYDEVIDGERHIAQNIADAYKNTYGFPVDYDNAYVGLPTAISAGAGYNLSESVAQGTLNLHVSQLNSMYKEASGDHLKARLLSAAEVNFIIAEAAAKGWTSGSAETYYNEAIAQSFKTWGLDSAYSTYISGNAAYNSPDDIIKQKWIASWTATTEAWFDYRRTGLPNLIAGPSAKRQALPLRFYYDLSEINNNTDNVNAAIEKLEKTSFNGSDDENSAWSKMWLLSDTNQPY